MSAPASPRRTILIAEDDLATRETLDMALGQEGYQVAHAANGREVLERLRDEPAPDLILLDMMMPVMDGWQLLDELKERPPARAIPVVLMTAAPLSPAWAQEHGCVGFVAKPLDLPYLLAEVRHCLQRS